MLSAVETSRTTRTALLLARSEIIRKCLRVLRTVAATTVHSRAVFMFLRARDCAATFRGLRVFEGGVYSKKYGVRKEERWIFCYTLYLSWASDNSHAAMTNWAHFAYFHLAY